MICRQQLVGGRAAGQRATRGNRCKDKRARAASGSGRPHAPSPPPSPQPPSEGVFDSPSGQTLSLCHLGRSARSEAMKGEKRCGEKKREREREGERERQRRRDRKRVGKKEGEAGGTRQVQQEPLSGRTSTCSTLRKALSTTGIAAARGGQERRLLTGQSCPEEGAACSWPEKAAHVPHSPSDSHRYSRHIPTHHSIVESRPRVSSSRKPKCPY